MSVKCDFRVFGWDVRFTKFQRDVVSSVVNQSWTDLCAIRQQAQLPGYWEGEGSFTSRALTEILVRSRLAAAGVEYSETAEVGCVATQSVLWHAITKQAGTCEISGAPRDVARCHDKIASTTQTASGLTDLGAPHHFIIVGSDGTMQLTKLDSPDIKRPPSQRRPRIDLQELASHLSATVQRPLFALGVSRHCKEKSVRMLSRPGARNISRELLPVYPHYT
jgi:hypothetical protein